MNDTTESVQAKSHDGISSGPTTTPRRPRFPSGTVALLCAGLILPACVTGKKGPSKESAAARAAAFTVDAPPPSMRKLGAEFEDKAVLLGVSMAKTANLKPGAEVQYTLYWKAKKPIEDGWKLFTHVLDNRGKKLLNIDAVGPIREYDHGRQPAAPSTWQPGNIYKDEQSFTIPKDYKGGKLKIITGIWKKDQRLAVMGKTKTNRAVVATLRLGEGGRHSTRVPELSVHRLAPGEKLKIDGNLDEGAWATAARTGPFVNVSTGKPDRGSGVQGNARVLWDNEALYVGAFIEDRDVQGSFAADSEDPHLWTKDTFELMIDPDGDGDNKDYYEIQVGPQNLVFDSQFDDYNQPKVAPNGPFGHQEWKSRLQSAVVIEGTLNASSDRDKGYTVELKLPWVALTKAKKSPPEAGATWRINFYAMQDNGGVAWSPILRQGNFHKASRFGRVRFVDVPSAPVSKHLSVGEAKELVVKDVRALAPKPAALGLRTKAPPATSKPKASTSPAQPAKSATAP